MRGARVTVHVTDQNGEPLQVPSLALFNADGSTAKVDGRRVTARGSINGKLDLLKILPGRYTAEVKLMGYRVERVPFEVTPGEEKILQVSLFPL